MCWELEKLESKLVSKFELATLKNSKNLSILHLR